MKKRYGDKQRLEHALDAIAEIESYVANQPFTDFLASSMMRFACIKPLEIVGEACNHVNPKTVANHPEVEWREIVGFRNLLIHEYYGVDAALVWDVIQTNLPNLKNQLSEIVLRG